MAQTVHLVPPQVVRHRLHSKVTRSSQWDLSIRGRRVELQCHIRDKGHLCIQVIIYKKYISVSADIRFFRQIDLNFKITGQLITYFNILSSISQSSFKISSKDKNLTGFGIKHHFVARSWRRSAIVFSIYGQELPFDVYNIKCPKISQVSVSIPSTKKVQYL